MANCLNNYFCLACSLPKKVCSGSHKRHNEQGATQCYQAFLVLTGSLATSEQSLDISATTLHLSFRFTQVLNFSFFKSISNTSRTYLRGFSREMVELRMSLILPPGDKPRSDSDPPWSGCEISATTLRRKS